jgi:hypothetical protein
MEEKSGMWRARGGGAGERVQRERGRASEQTCKREQGAGEREKEGRSARGGREKRERERRERYFFGRMSPHKWWWAAATRVAGVDGEFGYTPKFSGPSQDEMMAKL